MSLINSANNQIPKDLFIVVDDYVWVTRLAKWRLETAFGPGIQVELVKNGAEAVALFCNLVANGRHGHINTVFMDFHMPELIGTDAIRVLRLLEVLFDLPPANVIGCSADLSYDCRRLFYEAGANATLAKPVEFGEMEAMCLDV